MEYFIFTDDSFLITDSCYREKIQVLHKLINVLRNLHFIYCRCKRTCTVYVFRCFFTLEVGIVVYEILSDDKKS